MQEAGIVNTCVLTFTQYLTELYQEEPGSTFTDGNHRYDLDKIFRYSENIPTESINVKDLDWMLTGSKFTPNDSARISAIHDLTPILITKKGSRMLVVDGFHRLLKAKREGLQDILAKVIPQSIMDRCRIRVATLDPKHIPNHLVKESSETNGIPVKTVKWIYHPKFKTDSSITSSEHPVEHADLINRQSHPPDYDDIHKGKAYIKNGKIHTWWQANRTPEYSHNRFNMSHVANHLSKKYKGTVHWHSDGLEAAKSLVE